VQVGNQAATTALYDAQDRILSYGSQTYTHTDHGDLLTRVDGANSFTLTYDELGNLLKAVNVEGSTKTTVEYVVDGLGRRVARRINGSFDRAWLYRDSLRPVSEVDSAGVFTHFVYASNAEESGAPIALIRAGVFYRVVKDHLGSVRLVVNATTGEVAQSIDYDAYGRVINETGAGFQPFGFAGGLYDSATNLVRFGARDYDASTGRWTNKDPIGFAGQQGNVYLYVGGDPVNGVDLRGLDPSNGCVTESSDAFYACGVCLIAGAGTFVAACGSFGTAAILTGGAMIYQCAQCGTTVHRKLECEAKIAQYRSDEQSRKSEAVFEYECISKGNRIVRNPYGGGRLECIK
jgi:RHS repeat-associated protein